mgnify:CR=1 FL=1
MSDFSILINAVYVLCALLFIFGLKLLSHPSTARKGNLLSGLAMLIAVVVTLLDRQIISFEFILGAVVLGSAVEESGNDVHA